MDDKDLLQVLDFWFLPENQSYWFAKDHEFDKLITSRFASTHQILSEGKNDSWLASPKSCLAYIIVLDQFSRNMFRDDVRAFAYDDQALHAAKWAVKEHYDQQLLSHELSFLFMPFMHSENYNDQISGLNYYKKAGLEQNYEFALRHANVIKQFGRFPHRNEILKRPSTNKEIEYLASGGERF